MITKNEFDDFLNKCTVDWVGVIGHISEKKGKLKDEEGIVLASIDYMTGQTNVDEEIYISDSKCFRPSIIQEARILETIDTLTFDERENYEYDIRNRKLNELL